MSKNDMVMGLLPCPHCGRKEDEFHRYSRKIGFDVFYCIRCYCCAETIGQTESEAEQSWNTRVEPAKQHPGEPVALPERQPDDHFSEKLRDKAEGWNACLDEIAKLGPLYSRPVQGALLSFANEIISASYEGGSFEGGDIQDVAVKHGLLRIESRAEECGEACACREYGFPAECYRKTSLLSASAEPSAPVEEVNFDLESMKDAIRGPMIEMPEGVSREDFRSYMTSGAPVEIDELAAFDAWFKDHSKDWPFPSESIKCIARDNDWLVWQARAALERKS